MQPTRLRSAALALVAVLASAPSAGEALDASAVERFGRLALACAHQEYPNKIAHVLASDADARPPRELTPAFFGCYDWHSAVHGHWLLARLARLYPDNPAAADARGALARSLTAENLAAEVRYIEGAGRASFERPYGLAWLLQLAAELRQWDDPEARTWAEHLEPLERAAAARLREWIPKLSHPIRGGEHSQTAFAFGLIADWARVAGDRETGGVVRRASFRFYAEDRDCPLLYEPSGHDFLSPCLAEADLMRRFLSPVEFAAWLGAFLPSIPHDDADGSWLEPGVVSDPEDPKLAHLDGLNLSRAWMLEGIASALPALDPRLPPILAAARAHRDAGLAAVTGEHYEGGHWLGSFAMYLVSGRGGSRVLASGPFDILYRDVDRAAVERVVVPRAHRAFDDVTSYLGIDYPGTIIIHLANQHRIPRQWRNNIYLPADRVEGESRFGLSVVHEITHVVAISAYRREPNRFYDDGLAVYLQSRFAAVSSFPEFGNDLHQETVATAEAEGGFLPLATTERIRQTTRSASERRLAYLQEGSFTRFLIESRGLEDYLRVYYGESLDTVYGLDLEALEAEWLATITSPGPVE